MATVTWGQLCPASALTYTCTTSSVRPSLCAHPPIPDESNHTPIQPLVCYPRPPRSSPSARSYHGELGGERRRDARVALLLQRHQRVRRDGLNLRHDKVGLLLGHDTADGVAVQHGEDVRAVGDLHGGGVLVAVAGDHLDLCWKESAGVRCEGSEASLERFGEGGCLGPRTIDVCRITHHCPIRYGPAFEGGGRSCGSVLAMCLAHDGFGAERGNKRDDQRTPSRISSIATSLPSSPDPSSITRVAPGVREVPSVGDPAASLASLSEVMMANGTP